MDLWKHVLVLEGSQVKNQNRSNFINSVSLIRHILGIFQEYWTDIQIKATIKPFTFSLKYIKNKFTSIFGAPSTPILAPFNNER